MPSVTLYSFYEHHILHWSSPVVIGDLHLMYVLASGRQQWSPSSVLARRPKLSLRV